MRIRTRCRAPTNYALAVDVTPLACLEASIALGLPFALYRGDRIVFTKSGGRALDQREDAVILGTNPNPNAHPDPNPNPNTIAITVTATIFIAIAIAIAIANQQERTSAACGTDSTLVVVKALVREDLWRGVWLSRIRKILSCSGAAAVVLMVCTRRCPRLPWISRCLACPNSAADF